MSFDYRSYVHELDKTALQTLQAIPGFQQLITMFMKIWSEPQFKIMNMSSSIRVSPSQLSKYYDMLPPICEKLGIPVPELYLQLNVVPNSYTAGETNPFIVLTTGLLESLPDTLIPTILAHECGHIACHHVLYSTMGRILLGGTTGALKMRIPYGGLVALPLEVAFFHWMRCSELSADRAAMLCDGTHEKMSEVCMRLAGYNKRVEAIASKEEFLAQAREYCQMVQDSKWNKTLEFMALSQMTHPLMTVRTLECEEWGNSAQYRGLLDGTWSWKAEADEAQTSKQRFEFPKFPDIPDLFGKRPEEAPMDRQEAMRQLRDYQTLLEAGLITEEEYERKRRELLKL